MPQFSVVEKFNALDFVHYIDGQYVYASYKNHIYKRKPSSGTFEHIASLPVESVADSLKFTTKISRRVFRKRVENLVVLPSGTVIAVISGKIYRIQGNDRPEQVFNLKRCRGTLHRGIAIDSTGNMYLGEYYSNPERGAVSIYRGINDGSSWSKSYSNHAKKFRHYHGCFYDPWENCIWFTTGDNGGENFLARSNLDFTDVQFIAELSAVNLLITERYIYFANDNPYGQNFIQRLDKKTMSALKIFEISGPAWYGYQTSDGIMLFASTVEYSHNPQNLRGQLYASVDGLSWKSIYKWDKDNWRPWSVFQFGVINFPAGTPVGSDSIWLSGQAFVDCDMCVWKVAISVD